MWVDVRDNDGRLLFKYNPGKRLIEIVKRGRCTLVDLDRVAEALPAQAAQNLPIELQSQVC